MNKQYKDLKDLNHVLNLNYEETLDNNIIDNARVSMLMLANHIEEVWDIYKKEGYYIDEEAFELLDKTFGRLLNLCNTLEKFEE